MEQPFAREHAMLQKISDLLGVPIESFLASSLPLNSDMNTQQCLRLWHEISTEDGRKEALNALRAIANAGK